MHRERVAGSLGCACSSSSSKHVVGMLRYVERMLARQAVGFCTDWCIEARWVSVVVGNAMRDQAACRRALQWHVSAQLQTL
jgi:hypothetical protein